MHLKVKISSRKYKLLIVITVDTSSSTESSSWHLEKTWPKFPLGKIHQEPSFKKFNSCWLCVTWFVCLSAHIKKQVLIWCLFGNFALNQLGLQDMVSFTPFYKLFNYLSCFGSDLRWVWGRSEWPACATLILDTPGAFADVSYSIKKSCWWLIDHFCLL